MCRLISILPKKEYETNIHFYCMLFVSSEKQFPATSIIFHFTYLHFLSLPAWSEPVIKKNPSFKEKILSRWLKIKTHKQTGNEKKNVTRLGFLSLIGSIASPLLLILNFGISSIGVVQVISIFALLLLPASIILGIISLHKRKKLADKSGTSNIPALIGIAISGTLLLLFFIALFSFPVGF